MSGDTLNVSLGNVDYSLYPRRIPLRDVSHKKQMDKFAYNTVEYNILESQQKLSIRLPEKTVSSKKTFLTMLQFVGLLLQWIKTLRSFDCSLKIFSGINSLIWYKLVYWELVKQLQILMLLIFVVHSLWKREQRTFKMKSLQFQLIISKTTIN